MEEEYFKAMQAGFEDELEKIAAAAGMSPEEAALESAWAGFQRAKTPAHKIREGLAAGGGSMVGAALGAGAGALGAAGLHRLGVPVTPAGGALLGGLLGGSFGFDAGGIIGDSHGQSDVNLGRAYEHYAKLEDKVYGPGPVRAVPKAHSK